METMKRVSILVLVFAARFFGPLESTVAAMVLIPFSGLIVPMRICRHLIKDAITGP
jgi:hypothetical protein